MLVIVGNCNFIKLNIFKQSINLHFELNWTQGLFELNEYNWEKGGGKSKEMNSEEFQQGEFVPL